MRLPSLPWKSPGNYLGGKLSTAFAFTAFLYRIVIGLLMMNTGNPTFYDELSGIIGTDIIEAWNS
jgi:hypothetical protein